MAITSKYANLPFIASGEKDVFETDDLPEADQTTSQQPLCDASIEIIPSGTVEAFHKFAASNTKPDLKNQVEVSESFTDKFNRLKIEIEELKKCASSSIDSANGENMLTEVNNLTSRLDNLCDLHYKNSDSTKVIKDMKQVEKSGGDAPLVQYELFRKPEKDKIIELSKINALEQRLKKLESTLGLLDGGKDGSFPLWNNSLKEQSIASIVVQLSNKMMQLDHTSLDRIDARLHVILDKLNQVSEKRSALNDLDKENKLNQLYDCYVKLDHSRPLLPGIMERLQVFHQIQQQASQFSNTLNAMESMQQEIKASLESTRQNLKNLNELFEKKTQNVQQLISSFQERLEKVKS